MRNPCEERGAAGVKRTFAGEHFIQHHAYGPNVRAGIDAFAAHLLRTHVGRRPKQSPTSQHDRLIQQLRDAEIENLHHAIVSDEQIRRLDITMDDPRVVRLREPTRDLNRDLDGIRDVQRPARDPFVQRFADAERHHEKALAAVRGADLGYRTDVWMVERRGRPRLRFEATLCVTIVGQVR